MDEILLSLAQITFLTLKEKIILLKNLDSPDKLALMSMEDISQVVGRAVHPAFWDGRQNEAFAKRSALIMQKMQIKAVLYDDGSYPALLRETFDPPFMLFYRGDISVLAKQCVSVVGTRKICQEGAEAAFSFARDAALDGLTVVSGLAFGTDAYAHKGALAACEKDQVSGTTAAILPCGIDTVIPSSHKTLVQHILRTGGCVASEYVPGCPSEAWRFVQRNRIIAALSPATVVIQAPAGSGALITADFAVGYNRDVLLHEACFCPAAEKTAHKVEQQLAASKKSGAESKLERTVQKLRYDGAPVIADYAAYVAVRRDAPGTHCSKKYGQLELF